MRIFKGRNLETTSTIVKLRNSNRVEITTESDTGAIKETDLTNECDLTSKDGVKVLRDYLKNMTDRTASQRSAQIRSVQIGLPIPLLKVTQIMLIKVSLQYHNARISPITLTSVWIFAKSFINYIGLIQCIASKLLISL